MVLAQGEPALVLSNERLRASLAIRDWILGEAREIGDPNIILEGVSLMMRDAGVPIDRATSAVELRHAERAANARIWEFGSSAREHLYAHERGSDASGKRPLAEAHRLNKWIFTWLPDIGTCFTNSVGGVAGLDRQLRTFIQLPFRSLDDIS